MTSDVVNHQNPTEDGDGDFYQNYDINNEESVKIDQPSKASTPKSLI